MARTTVRSALFGSWCCVEGGVWTTITVEMISILLQALAQQGYSIVQSGNFAFLLHDHPLLFRNGCVGLVVLRPQVLNVAHHGVI